MLVVFPLIRGEHGLMSQARGTFKASREQDPGVPRPGCLLGVRRGVGRVVLLPGGHGFLPAAICVLRLWKNSTNLSGIAPLCSGASIRFFDKKG